jgi:hypothetical protein
MKCLLLVLFCGIACAQQLDLSVLDKLSSKASESSTVTLDAAKLKLASQFLSSEDASQEKTKSLITGLRGVFVRVFEFDNEGAYSPADLEAIRKQLTAPGWSNIVNVKDRDETAEVWLFSKGDVLDGLAVIAGETRELAVVNIVGQIDMNTLRKLGGSFGIPKIDSNMLGIQQKGTTKPKAQPKPAAPKRDDDEE